MKVYCKDCKNHNVWLMGAPPMNRDICTIDIFLDEIGNEVTKNKNSCKDRNEDNKCKDFNHKFLKRRKYANPKN